MIAYSDGGYTTNLPLADVVNDQAFVAYGYDGAPLDAGTRRTGAPGRAAPVLLEERQMDPRPPRRRTVTNPDSGSRSAITTVATHGLKSATRATDEMAANQLARRDGRRNPPRDAARQDNFAQRSWLDDAPGGTARRHPTDS